MKFNKKKTLLFLIDVIILVVSVGITLYLSSVIKDYTDEMRKLLLIFGSMFVVLTMITMPSMKVYKGILRFATVIDFIRVTFSVLISGVISSVTVIVYDFINGGSVLNELFLAETKKFILSAILIVAFSLTTLLTARMIYCGIMIYKRKTKKKVVENRKKTLIVGAGETCKIILGEMEGDFSAYEPVCILDDDSNKISRRINNIPVYGNTEIISEACKKFNVELIVFAIPSCDEEDKRRILTLCHETGKETLVLPSLSVELVIANTE